MVQETATSLNDSKSFKNQNAFETDSRVSTTAVPLPSESSDVGIGAWWFVVGSALSVLLIWSI